MEHECVGFPKALLQIESKSAAYCVPRYSRHRSFRISTQGQTVNRTVYKEILRPLVRSVRDKRWSLWEAHAWTLHHDNAPAHTALNIRQFLAEILQLWNNPYIPPIWPRVTFFSCLRFDQNFDIDSIKMAATTELKKIPENAFQECFES